MSSKPATETGARVGLNRRLLTKLSVVAVLMFGFGYAMVPFYDAICRELGLNDIGRPDAKLAAAGAANTQVDTTRSITIELDSNTHGLPWTFRPLTRHLQAHPGALVQVEYEVTNTRDVPVTGQAIPSYAPERAAQYFRKLECFCFKAQTLKPGEVRRMPVVFVVDAGLPRDIHSITLSYTFFEVPGGVGRGA